jgi:hypothetical protein
MRPNVKALLVVGAIVLLTPAAARSQAKQTPAPAPPPPAVVTKFKPAELATILQNAGYRAEVVFVDSKPRIRTGMSGYNVTIYLYSCEEDSGCGSITFYAGFTKTAQNTLSLANKWNQEKRYVKAYIDTDGDLAMEYDVSFFGGATSDTFKQSANMFENLLASYKTFGK